MRANRRRSGFTLLEVLLASLIAVLLLAALYFAMDVTLRQTQESRDGVDVENLSRGVYSRMSQDFSASLGPLPPKSGGNAAASAAAPASDPSMMTTTDPSMMTTPAAGAGTTPAAGAPTTPATSTDPTMMTTTTTDPETGEVTAAPQAADVSFQGGIVGTETQLTVFASRLPLAMTSARGLSDPGGVQQPADLVRITWWGSQDGGRGLFRQERPWVTQDGVRNSTDPDLSDEAGDMLVPEVTKVTFAYFDPQAQDFVPTWDGTQMSPDGVTPIGPPRAVKVTLEYEVPSGRPGGQPIRQTVVQVIPVRAAPGPLTPSGMGTTSNMNTTGGNSSTPMGGSASSPTGGTGGNTKTGGTGGGGNTKTGGAGGGGNTKTGGGGGTGGNTKTGGGTGGGGNTKTGGR